MRLIVQKFGGTSVADAPKIHRAARRAIRAKLENRQVVMVVSAMGHTTDHLLALAKEVSGSPPKRELDMLLTTGEQVSIALMAMAISAAGAGTARLAARLPKTPRERARRAGCSGGEDLMACMLSLRLASANRFSAIDLALEFSIAAPGPQE